jgi:hypothetical protein
VVIQIVKVKGVGVDKAENHPPVCTHNYCPKSFEHAFERMQPETGHIHVGYGAGRIEPRQNIAELSDVFGKYTARIVVCMQTF